ncbi:hypothetical protein jhhlp_008213 [Lomentospora prolificans]|uniref:Heterokaryon incompatibility domain-containing protein n=1 Tax=Lomentospora prolificans TaxID=41688 RepID=A0A2N3MZD3_9PEZI|nr:hypothetical protein jhhlp_008213 [Lomentospora prolificans]
MATPSKLCAVCLKVLSSKLQDVREKSLSATCEHHPTLASFQNAASDGCFVCSVLWDSVSDESRASWQVMDPWTPLTCTLERRPWAPEWYEPIYWQFTYWVFNLGPVDIKYRGHTFCLGPENWGDPTLKETMFVKFESSTSSPKVLEVALEWHRACRESHQMCNLMGPRHTFIPTRLIDVGASGDVEWKLCVKHEDILGAPDYATLSYRWGSDPSIALRTSNLDSFRHGQPISNLPLTFRDAITVARRFEIRYLWIDSLCILQDSPEDWTRESVKMHEVYTHSACNIMASAADSPQGGLFRTRAADDALTGFVKLDRLGRDPVKFDMWDEYYIERLTHGPLTHRGWIFQERFLSPRALHFTEGQLVWECFEMEKCEMFPRWSPYPTAVPTQLSLKSVHPFSTNIGDSESRYEPPSCEEETMHPKMSISVYNQWCRLLEQYSKCSLTRPDDRLIAMSGIAEMYRRQTGDEYLAGLWRSRLLDGLNWVVLEPASAPENTSRAPSWSWAAVDSHISPRQITLGGDYIVSVINASVTTLADRATGHYVIAGSVELRGCVTHLTISEVGERQPLAENIKVQVAELASVLWVYPDTTEPTLEREKPLHILPFKTSVCKLMDGTVEKRSLMLEGVLVAPAPSCNGQYRRVGRVVIRGCDDFEVLGLRVVLANYCGSAPEPARAEFSDEGRISVITLI